MNEKTKERVFELHGQGVPCSAIDVALSLTPNTAKRLIVGAWIDDNGGVKETTRAASKPKPKAKPAPAKPKAAVRKFSDETVRGIRASKGKAPAEKVARRFGVSASSVRRIWSGETYKEVN